MLPVNIIANWCRAAATLDDFRSVLNEYVEDAAYEEYPENTHTINWHERTLFTFGDSEWSRNEGSLIFQNRRVALWREGLSQQNQAHLIFIALFPSSLVHLQQSITKLMREKREVEIVQTNLDLLEAARTLSPTIIAATEIINSKMERTIFSGASSVNELERIKEQQWDIDVSRLVLRIDVPKTDITLSSDGVMTFNNPDLTVGEIVYLISEATKAIPFRRVKPEPLKFLSEINEGVRFYEEEK